MIRPKIPLVQSGQRLTSDLVNAILNRTEYAADLLRQYKLVAGSGMYVEPHYDGTRVSYLQPVGGGQNLPPPDFGGEDIYRIIGFFGTIYNPVTNEYSDVPNKNGLDRFYGISGNNYFGYISSGAIDNGVTNENGLRRQIVFGDYTRFYGGDGNFAVGEYYDLNDPGVPVFGVKCNLDGSGFEKIEYPNIVPIGTYSKQNVFLSDIHDGNIVGLSTLRNTIGQTFLKNFLRTSGGQFIDLPEEPTKIYGDYITLGRIGAIYKISDATTKTILYNGNPTRLYGIYKNFVNGTQSNSSNPFIYNILTDSFTTIEFAGEDMG